MARKFPVSCKLPTVIVFVMVSESNGSGATEDVTLTDRGCRDGMPSAFVQTAVTVH